MSRIFISFGLFFLIIFSTIIVLLHYSPQHLSSLIFINPSICSGGCICSGCQKGPVDLLSNVPMKDLEISYEWPDQIDLNSSDTITVHLASNGVVPFFPTASPTQGSNRRLGAAYPYRSANYIGTPFADSVTNAFGPGYNTSVTAQLLTTTFDVKTFQPSEQSLNEPSIEWSWNIKPTTLGSQSINLSIDILWKPTSGGQVIQSEIWQTPITITITQPFLELGQLSLAALITGALASGGLIVGIITSVLDKFWKKREGDDNKQKTNGVRTEKKEKETEKEFLPKKQIAPKPVRRSVFHPSSLSDVDDFGNL